MFKLIVKNKSAPSITGTSQTTTVNVGTTPSGPQGPEGPPGPRGYKGEASSVPGPKGEPGPRGYKGEDSYVPGPKGDTGPKGDKGDPFIYTDFTQPQLAALKGAKGDTGAKGSTGLKGDKGPKGDKGDTGSGAAWGNITGDIEDQLDLSELYYTKADAYETNNLLFQGMNYLSKNGDYYDTTTAAYPNVNIAADGALSRSTATFGTAAYKDVGTEAGNVMEVGAFGVGSSNDARNKDSSANRLINTGLSLEFNHTNLGGAAYGSFLNLGAYVDSTGYEGINRLIVNPRGMWVQSTVAVGGGLAYAEPREVVLKDATGNVAVESIQAGFDAPKLMFKVLEVPRMTSSVEHGISDALNRITAISGVSTDGSTSSLISFTFTSQKITITGSPTNQTKRILITYLA